MDIRHPAVAVKYRYLYKSCGWIAIVGLMEEFLNRQKLSDLVSAGAKTHLQAFRRDVEKSLPGKVAKMVLFGSRARGDARKSSDYDVAVFVTGLKNRRPVDHLLADVAYNHVLEGFHIRPVAVPADYLQSRPDDALAVNILREGIIVA